MINQLEHKRHSLAHLLAAAVMELWPDTKRTIGPAINDGFYYDFDFTEKITEADLKKIEDKMRELYNTWDKFTGREVTIAEAKKEFKGNEYKLELIDEFSKESSKLTFFKSGNYIDLCRGGHVESMKDIKPDSWKLDRLAGAYWRGDEKNKMLTRIYGLSFDTKKELADHVKMREEAKKRDHKILGPQLDLFTFSELVGGGLPLWTPKGTLMRNLLNDFVWELRRTRGYEQVEIPHITKKDLYEISGHWDKFKNELFKIETREGHIFAMKPMNCPHHTQIYKRKKWSYRELPQRYANTTMVYRDEQSGELAGLLRVRSITQDDAHVFCRSAQVAGEANKIWDIVHAFYKAAGFNLEIRLSLHDPKQMDKYLGTEKNWLQAEEELRKVIKEHKADFIEALGEAAFYGPKIDFMAKDSIGREWQVATIQLDMNLPERFDLSCVNEKGQDERIVMVHAAIMGSIERYLSILIEHFAGAFPTWLSPVQIKILPVGAAHHDYCYKLYEQLRSNNIRCEVDDANETIGNKIRKSEHEKVPYTLVIGDKEIKSGELAVRIRGQKELENIKLDKFIATLLKEITDRK